MEPNYDPMDPAVIADPYPLYERIRDHWPIFWHPQSNSWAVSRYDDCVDVLRAAEGYARDWRRVGEAIPEPRLSVQTLDPPDQGPLRSLFMNALHAQPITVIADRTGELVDKALHRLQGSGVFDFQREIAVPASLFAISELMGVAEPDVESFSQTSDAIMQSMDGSMRPDIVRRGERARARLSDLVESWFDADPRSGILSDVREAAPTVEVSPDYVKNTSRVMFQGGYSTMVAALGNIGHLLMTRPELLEDLGNRAFIDSGVEELLRFEGPVQGTSRAVTVPVELHGVRLVPGDVVLVLLAAANRDPRQFDRPDEVVLDRSPNRHLSFGWGPHACIGTLLAQVVVNALVATMTVWSSRIRLHSRAIRSTTATMRKFETIPTVC